ncbi:hypothetical protein QZH56_10875 [Streptomyces olivoreticuli]|uniref:Integral membrane protein n=1 Tax=Streptomyces blastmyceticus TaxID=68180 RepID=A0ABP3HS88_9ACTN|nr:hypothetical protein [Streptomyces olivoreticuli]WKK26044.1 hypothetical protein QZH56_10875 [Streptomyces olivoreticuli]
MILWEALGSVLIGLAVSYGALRWLPARYGQFRPRSLALATGPVAALFGALIGHSVLGPGHAPAVLAVSLGVSVALLSLLVRQGDRPRRSATA